MNTIAGTGGKIIALPGAPTGHVARARERHQLARQAWHKQQLAARQRESDAREAVRSSSVSLLPSAPSCSPAGRAANDVLLPLPPLLPLMAAAVPAKELLAIQELRRRLFGLPPMTYR